ncbi:MAG: hypothetical protein H6Q04_1069 [Acidobacteria bacterium]|jgi:hypothetical protein|nr:hypothetical protein [Acidobacteriota bacterium]
MDFTPQATRSSGMQTILVARAEKRFKGVYVHANVGCTSKTVFGRMIQRQIHVFEYVYVEVPVVMDLVVDSFCWCIQATVLPSN